MNNVKQKFAYVLKSVKKDFTLKQKIKNLEGKTYVVSGGSRGIGLSIAKKISNLGGNVAILGKTSKFHPKLEGTVYTAVDEIKKQTDPKKNNDVLGLICDIRDNQNIDNSIEKVVNHFGSIDGVILNASALCLSPTLKQKHKEIDLMSDVNINGTFKVGKECLKYIKNSEHGNVLIIAPPLDMLYNDDWWINHLYYSISKFNMSLMSKYWDKEFPNIGVNSLWPRTTIATAPVKNLLGGDEMVNISRKPEIMGDAASYILRADPKICSGKNFIDDEVLISLDKDIEKYRINENIKEKDLMPDFFC